MSGSVLETFYLMFKTNADEVKKGTAEAGQAADKLEQKLRSTDAVTQKLGGSFLGMARSAAGALGAILSVGAITREVFQAEYYANQIGDASEALGENIETMSQWADAVTQLGGNAQTAIGAFNSLAGSLAQLDATGKSRVTPFFDELGISLTDAQGKTKKVNDILLELADKFEHMDKQSSFGFARKLQIEGMIKLLQSGRKGVEDLLEAQKELGVVTERDNQVSEEWIQTKNQASHAARTFALEIGSILLPPLTKGLQWLIDNREGVKAFFVGVAGAITLAFLPAIIAATASMITFVATAVGFIGIGGTLMGLLQMLAGGMLALAAAIPFWGWAIAAGAAFAYIYTHWENLKGNLLSGIEQLKKPFEDLWGWLKGPFANGEMKATLNAVGSGQNALNSASATPLNAITSNSLSTATNANRISNITVQNVSVNTQATDAAGIASSFGKALTDQLRQTTAYFDDGVE